ncbi:MAG: BatD family protein [Chitinophagaceae bacterium]|nr:BatD family protein [Chitinophagaceae bacterium]
MKMYFLFKAFIGFSVLLFSQKAFSQDFVYARQGENLILKTGKYIFIDVSVNKNEAFVGECITAVYKLYVAAEISGKLAKAPSYKGFASYDMKPADSESYEVEKKGNTIFRVYHIKSVQLFGLKPGIQRLEPIEIDTEVKYKWVRKNDNINQAPLTDTVIAFVAKSKPVNIHVKPLPENESGGKLLGVGSFNLKADVSKKVIPALQADTISFTIQGSGNWYAITNPAVQWPTGLEVFEPKVVEDLDTRKAPVLGTRTIQYPVVANTPGTYTLPSVSFKVFDPSSASYKTVQTEPITWTVSEAAKIKPRQENDDSGRFTTTIFSKIAVILFPVAAIALIIIVLGKKKNNED